MCMMKASSLMTSHLTADASSSRRRSEGRRSCTSGSYSHRSTALCKGYAAWAALIAAIVTTTTPWRWMEVQVAEVVKGRSGRRARHVVIEVAAAAIPTILTMTALAVQVVAIEATGRNRLIGKP